MFKHLLASNTMAFTQEAHVTEISIERHRKEHTRHFLFCSEGIAQNEGVLISSLRKDYAQNQWWMVPEEIEKGRALKIWLLCPSGVSPWTNPSNATYPSPDRSYSVLSGVKPSLQIRNF